MEPSKTHGTTSPQQDLTQSVGGCLSGLRPADLLLGGQGGADPLVGPRVAIEAVDRATAGTLQPPRVSASTQGEAGGLPSHLTRLKAYQILVQLAKKSGKKVRPTEVSIHDRTAAVLQALGITSNLKNDEGLKTFLGTFTYKCEALYKKCKYNLKFFTKKHEKWLNADFTSEFLRHKVSVNPFIISSSSNPLHRPGSTLILDSNDSDFSSIPNSNFVPEPGSFILDSDPRLPGPSSADPKPQPESCFILGSNVILEPGPSSILDSDPRSKPGPSSLLSPVATNEVFSQRQQRRTRKCIQDYLEKEPSKKIVRVFANTVEVDGHKLKKSTTKDLEYVFNSCLENPTRPTKVATKLRTNPTPYTPEEALAIYIDRKFSVETYDFLQQDLKEHDFNVFPSYDQVRKAKRLCYPSDPVNVSEREASISLSSLLSHTFKRIVQSCDATFSHYCSQKKLNRLKCVFEGSWGFDGSTGQSLYEQKFSQSQEDDSSLLATTFIPLQIKTECGQVLWLNPNPKSFRYCRPLRIHYRKETKDLIIAEKKLIEDRIEELRTCITETSNKQIIRATFQIYLTITDEKVLNIITNTTTQLRCPFCKSTSSQFNDLDLVFSKATDESLLKYGLNPVQAWIHMLEFLLQLAYKNPVKKWRVPKNSPEARVVEETKKRIQEEIRTKLGLLVDVVRPNSGTTNDGNTARTALSDKNRAAFAEILGLRQWLVDDLHIILVVLSCELPVNADKFGDFCRIVANKYVSEYPWYPMTVTLHKILVHSKEIIKNSALPVGLLPEQADEARNKFWRYDREHHTRKIDREERMLDLFNRALESSDPFISNVRLQERLKILKRQSILVEVLQLLKPYEVPADDPELSEADEETIDLVEYDELNYDKILTTEDIDVLEDE